MFKIVSEVFLGRPIDYHYKFYSCDLSIFDKSVPCLLNLVRNCFH